MKFFRSGGAARALPTLLALIAAAAFGTTSARAMGTVTIVQSNGQTNVYHDAVIKVIRNALYVTSGDGKGTIVIDKAACSYQGEVMVCFVTHATLVQAGSASPLDFKTGTVYVNSTDDPQPLTLSSQKVPAHGILLSFTTQRGTYVSVTGGIDKVVK